MTKIVGYRQNDQKNFGSFWKCWLIDSSWKNSMLFLLNSVKPCMQFLSGSISKVGDGK